MGESEMRVGWGLLKWAKKFLESNSVLYAAKEYPLSFP